MKYLAYKHYRHNTSLLKHYTPDNPLILATLLLTRILEKETFKKKYGAILIYTSKYVRKLGWPIIVGRREYKISTKIHPTPVKGP